MAKSGRKQVRKAKKVGRFGVVMTNKIRLLLFGCFILGFIGMGIIALWRG